MTQRKRTKLALAICLAAIIGVATGCVDEKNLYDPEFNKSLLPNGTKEFGFATRAEVKLSVNYGVPGFKTLIEVYDEEPITGSSYEVKEGLASIYSAYTDENGKFEGTMTIPTSTKKVYLYTCLIGLPQCVELTATAAGFSYDATQATQGRAAATRAPGDVGVDTGTFPYRLLSLDRPDNAYSLVKWNVNGVISGEHVSKITTLGSESIGALSDRVTKFLVANNTVDKNVVGNRNLLREPNQINIKSAEGMEVSITFVGSKGAFLNSFGYYYYKTEPSMKMEDFYGMKKYVLFPNTNNHSLTVVPVGTTVKLVYFDDDGKAQTKFPAGYTVGWFLISNGFNAAPQVATLDGHSYKPNPFYKYRNVCISNDVKIGGDDYRQFITMYDQKSKLRIVGIEDSLYPTHSGDDYMDLTFFVSTTPELDNDDELPEVPDPEPAGGTLSQSGTLAFEDNWPNKGDYDLNDVAVEYKREVTFDSNNKATELVETFKFIQGDDAASFTDYFAYQTKNMGTITSAEGCTVEQETGSIIINGSSKANKDKTFTIKRTLNGDVNKDDILKDFNPYIIVGELGKNRTEVHLPNGEFTSNADQSKLFTGVEAYYIYTDGKHPFAINVPIVNFELPTERASIDESYPKFSEWAASLGQSFEDWYVK